MATKVLFCFQHYSILSHDLSAPGFFPVTYLRDSYDGVTVNKAIAWNDNEDFPLLFYYIALDFSRKEKKNKEFYEWERILFIIIIFHREIYLGFFPT